MQCIFYIRLCELPIACQPLPSFHSHSSRLGFALRSVSLVRLPGSWMAVPPLQLPILKDSKDRDPKGRAECGLQGVQVTWAPFNGSSGNVVCAPGFDSF